MKSLQSTLSLSRYLFYLLSYFLLLSCKPDADMAIGAPEIKAVTAKITGKIMAPKEKPEGNIIVHLFVPHPVSGEIVEYKTPSDQSGEFSIDVEVETDISIIALYTSLKPHHAVVLKVKSGNTTHVDVTYNQNFTIEDVQSKPEMNKNEMMRTGTLIDQVLGIYDAKPDPQMDLNDTSPEAFKKHIQTTVSDKLKLVERDSLLSNEWKEFISRDLRMWYYSLGLSTTVIPIQQMDKSYFTFLKDLELNKPQYLLCSSFIQFQKAILKNKVLALPEIGESDIPSWIAQAKGILSDVVGFNEGQYYDILAANAYCRQLNEEKRPLTEKQKNNIAQYWKDGEIAKILLHKNEVVVN